jgi:hypothetical protein
MEGVSCTSRGVRETRFSSSLFGGQSQGQLLFRVSYHLDSFVDDVVNLHAGSVRGELETKDSSNLVRSSKDSIEIGFRVGGRETVSDTG